MTSQDFIEIFTQICETIMIPAAVSKIKQGTVQQTSDNLEWSTDAFSDVTQSFLYKLVCCCTTMSIANAPNDLKYSWTDSHRIIANIT